MGSQNRPTLATLPLDVLLMILLDLHIIDIFPLKLAGSRHITDAIRQYYPLSPTRRGYIDAITAEMISRRHKHLTHDRCERALQFTVARGQTNLLKDELTRHHQRSYLVFWTIRALRRLFRIKPHKERLSESLIWPWGRGLSALHFAGVFNSPSLVKSGAPWPWIDCRTSYKGMTPLHLACQHGHVEIVVLLLEMGASVWARDDCRCTPLSLAVECNRKGVLEVLLQHQRTSWTRVFHRASLAQARHFAKKAKRVDLVPLLESELQARRIGRSR